MERVTGYGDKSFIEKVDKLIQKYLKSDQLNIPFVCENINMAQSTFYKSLRRYTRYPLTTTFVSNVCNMLLKFCWMWIRYMFLM